MKTTKCLALVATLLLLSAPVAPVSAQDSFGSDERFDSDFYGDLATGRDEPIYAGDTGYYGSDSASGRRMAAAPVAAAQSIKQDASVPTQYVPWSGMWWPRSRCDLAFGDFGGGLSPLEKYDSIVASLYGRLPGAAAWEADPVHRHNYAGASGVNWGGHCNGLAAAAILVPEPRKSLTVPLGNRPVKVKLNTGRASSAREYLFSDGQPDYRVLSNPGKSLVLSVADMKGLLSETYMTCNTQQFYSQKILGTRYDRDVIDPNDGSFKDIYPHYFHWLLQEFVKKNGMAIVAEIDAKQSVNNHPLFKFESNATYKPSQRKYTIVTKCTFTDYAKTAQFVGTNTMTRTYTYDLYQDSSGRVNRGDWTGASASNHPDFCWIPTSDASPSGTYENGSVNGDFVRWVYNQYGR
ncbi:MAG: hypothetical protein HY814_00970 [Candidatus Riflebacteria bacterium]|nr:hypothetical protein [Candidatus Riflebacteria bacterium]